MRIYPHALLCSLLFVAACGTGLITGSEDDGDDGATGTDDGVGEYPDMSLDDGECEAVVECDSDGRCWAYADGWPAWAQALAGPLSEYIDAGLLIDAPTEAGDQCGKLANKDDDFLVCVARRGCVTLIGIPVSQTVVGSACDLGEPWAYSFEYAGTCWGVLSGLAVALNTERPLP